MDGIMQKQTVQDIANAIREQNGQLRRYTPAEMANAIETLPDYYIDTPFEDILLRTATVVRNRNVVNQSHGLRNYTTLEAVDFPNATSVDLYGCTSLKTANLPSLSQISGGAFQNCKSLEELVFPSEITIGGTYGFESCENLKKIDFYSKVTFNGDHTFSCCYNLTAIILRYDGVCPMTNYNSLHSAQPNPITQGTGYIYVPYAHLAAYQKDIYWSIDVKNHGFPKFRAIEHYPHICGEPINV